jgi:hypothetical protein
MVNNNEQKKYFEHLDRNKDDPLLVKSITGESSLENQVQEFYGISRSDSSEISKQESEETRKISEELIKIIAPFSKKDLDLSKLEYKEVRDDYMRNSISFAKNLLNVSTILGTCLITAGSGFYSIQAYTSGDPIKGSIALLISVAGGYSYFKAIKRSSQQPKGSRGQILEFYALKEGAIIADDFIKDKYRPYLLEKILGEDSR